MNKTLWSLLALGTTLAGVAIGFYVWNDFWPAVLVGLVVGGAIRALQVLFSGNVTWASAIGWFVATVVAAVAGILAYTAWGQLWLAVVVASVTAGIMGALASVLVWLVEPTPVDLDAMLGRPDDIWWKLRDTEGWQRLSRWVERRSGSRTRSAESRGK